MLGQIMQQIASPQGAAASLNVLADPFLIRRIELAGAEHDESPEEYLAGAVQRFANAADDDAWLRLMTAIERDDVPARAALVSMAEWALKIDSANSHGTGCACQSGTGAHGDVEGGT